MITREQIEAFREYVADAPERAGAYRGRWFRVAERELCDLALAGLGAQWQPMETAPRDGRDILLAAGDVTVGFSCVDKWSGVSGQPVYGPVAWMPLPKPPEASR